MTVRVTVHNPDNSECTARLGVLTCLYQQITALQPISVLDVFQTLQVKKNVISWHTVHAINMERISQRLYYPS
ncbi:hypothetical protein OUZ56_017773 [Daphnia magna]|uniref:Uncharacterized protein n=1 Tax=Daphnia magna TaxID=35525 RepID=A0ABR0ATS2_9CRUS|nr:hypothetical protein OUZ56_017773 [Daphnia magna]